LPSSTLLAWDLLCLGRPVIGESFSHGTLSNRLEVWVDDAPLLIERLHLADGRLASVAQSRGSARCCSIRPAKPCSTACATLTPLAITPAPR
jgi:urease accessory protein UreH